MTTKRNLLGLPWPALTDFFADLGQPEYRARQLMEWVYRHGVSDFEQMTNFPKKLRQQLAEAAVIGVGQVIARQSAPDGTTKLAIAFPDDKIVECVILNYHHGVTLCLSSQVGCKMGCAFCASGLEGFAADLTAAEIIEQIWWANKELAPRQQRVGHLVYMGMGEPLDNYSQVLNSIRMANNKLCYNIGLRNITISTAGIVPAIRQLAEENLPITLAVSLHAPMDYLRDQLMPVNRRYPLSKLIPAVRDYAVATRRRVTFEYVLLAGVNDQLVHAEKLADLVAGIMADVNVIPYNEVAGLPWQTPSEGQVRTFIRALERRGVAVTLRRELGPEIEAACGQLRRRLQGEE
ncbi:MAG: 23S rRNA (adenine(2503)-C(2))-methyltransferase RlmN [Firmicutes bacterium]|nr:23S rRNA (adenine(2503)-C(2))-methyltransferase RlmN [Bacillota bacterium]